MQIDPKSVKRLRRCQSFFVLVTPVLAKVACRTLMKLTQGVIFINILRAAFVLIFFCQKVPIAKL